MYAIKLITLVFDFGIFIILFQIIKKYQRPALYILAGIFNFALLYNTIIWGQIDSIPVFFVLAGIWALLNNKRYLAITLYLIGISFKVQMVVFIPVFGLILLTHFWQEKKRYYELLKAVFYALSIEAIIMAPFIIAGKLTNLIQVVTGSVGFYKDISLNAYNFWLLLKGPGAINTPDTEIFFAGINYHQAGLAMFIVAFIVITLPSLYTTYKMLQAKSFKWFNKEFFALASLTMALTMTAFFFFNTEMHERYLFPALVFYGIHALLTKIPWMYILISIGFFINVEWVLGWFAILRKIPVIGSRPAAILIAAALFLGIFYLYKQFKEIRAKKSFK